MGIRAMYIYIIQLRIQMNTKVKEVNIRQEVSVNVIGTKEGKWKISKKRNVN